MATDFKPGDLVRRFAALYDWPVAERTILVEGEHDRRYFQLADRLYRRETGFSLLGGQLAAFPTGIGDEGGVFGIQRHFHPLRAIMDRDLTPEGRKVFHAIALFDSDMEGKKGVAFLTSHHLRFEKWRDVFILQRVLPRVGRDPRALDKAVVQSNMQWKNLDCEIEDLVSLDLVQSFIADTPNCLKRPLQIEAGGIHCEFHRHEKSNFVRFVEDFALLKDLAGIVELIKSLRYYLNLPVDGDPV